MQGMTTQGNPEATGRKQLAPTASWCLVPRIICCLWSAQMRITSRSNLFTADSCFQSAVSRGADVILTRSSCRLFARSNRVYEVQRRIVYSRSKRILLAL